MKFLFPERIILLARNLARLRSAASPIAPNRPARDMSGFLIRQMKTQALCSRHAESLRRTAIRFLKEREKR